MCNYMLLQKRRKTAVSAKIHYNEKFIIQI